MSIWKLVRDDPEYLLKEIEMFKKTFLPLDNSEKLIRCIEITSKLEKYIGKKRTVMYLLMIYCSFHGCIERNNKFEISYLYSEIYKNKGIHFFTEKYKEKIRILSKFLSRGGVPITKTTLKY